MKWSCSFELDNFLNVFEHTLYLKEQGLVSGGV